jgi:hypothetical protein
VTRSQSLLIGGLAVGVLLIWVAVAVVLIPAVTRGDDIAAASPTPSAAAAPSPSLAPTALPTVSPTLEPATTGPTTEPTFAATPEPTDTPTRSPHLPEPSGDPRLLYAEFLLRLDDARAEVAPLNTALVRAARVGNATGVKSAAVAILQFTDRERDWLLGHPPTACYANAHEAAGSMLEAYATVADRAIEWTTAETGLPALEALTRVLAATDEAQAALIELGEALESSTCLG